MSASSSLELINIVSAFYRFVLLANLISVGFKKIFATILMEKRLKLENLAKLLDKEVQEVQVNSTTLFQFNNTTLS